jgi:hypothetical protein
VENGEWASIAHSSLFAHSGTVRLPVRKGVKDDVKNGVKERREERRENA